MRLLSLALAALAAAALATPAAAHTGLGLLSGLGHGFAHPFLGLDHMLAMTSVGVWAAQQGGRTAWIVPSAFVATMALGGVLGMLGAGVGGTESVIVASVLILGAVVAAALRPPLWLAVPLVGALAIFHGVAHGRELPEATNASTYALGFIAATMILHATGLALAFALRSARQRAALRAAGVAQIGVGVLLAAGAF
jgi:urease accessory protein